MVNTLTEADLNVSLNKYLQKAAPGIQYLVVDKHQAIFEFAGGWADIQNQRPMRLSTTLMAYSMTKTFTAVAILQLVQQEKLHKEGGGGGFHSEMRLYPIRQFASITMVNSTEFNSNVFLSSLDKAFLKNP